MFAEHIAIKLGLNNGKMYDKFPNIWKLSNA